MKLRLWWGGKKTSGQSPNVASKKEISFHYFWAHRLFIFQQRFDEDIIVHIWCPWTEAASAYSPCIAQLGAEGIEDLLPPARECQVKLAAFLFCTETVNSSALFQETWKKFCIFLRFFKYSKMFFLTSPFMVLKISPSGQWKRLAWIWKHTQERDTDVISTVILYSLTHW